MIYCMDQAKLLGSSIQPEQFGYIQHFSISGEVADFIDDVVDVGQEVVDVSGDLGFLLHDGGIGVDEEWACQWVGEAVDGIEGSLDAIDGEHVGDIGVLDIVGIAIETDGIGAADDALDKHVVVFRKLCVAGV